MKAEQLWFVFGLTLYAAGNSIIALGYLACFRAAARAPATG